MEGDECIVRETESRIEAEGVPRVGMITNRRCVIGRTRNPKSMKSVDRGDGVR